MTRVGLLARVDPPVLAEDRALAEGLATHAAHVGPLSGVGSLVLEKVGAPAKALPALHAPVGSLPARNGWSLSDRHALTQGPAFRGAGVAGTQTEALLGLAASLVAPLGWCFPQSRWCFL